MRCRFSALCILFMALVLTDQNVQENGEAHLKTENSAASTNNNGEQYSHARESRETTDRTRRPQRVTDPATEETTEAQEEDPTKYTTLTSPTPLSAAQSHVHYKNELKGSDNSFDRCHRCMSRQDEKKLRLELIKVHILKQLGMESAPDIKHTEVPKIPTIQRVINQYSMQGDAPYGGSYRSVDVDDDSFENVQKIMFSHRVPQHLNINSTDAFHFIVQPVPYRQVIDKAILWLYLRPAKVGHSSRTTLSVYKLVASSRENQAPLKVQLQQRKVHLTKSGDWEQFEIGTLVKMWTRYPSCNFGLIATAKGHNDENAVVLHPTNSQDNGYQPFLELRLSQNRRRRHKRNVGLVCDDNTIEERCCHYPLEVNFVDFGWTWIIVPTKYHANYCSGDCPLMFLQNLAHTQFVQKGKTNTSKIICCTPTKLKSLSLLYFNDSFQVVKKNLPDMIVEWCGCR